MILYQNVIIKHTVKVIAKAIQLLHANPIRGGISSVKEAPYRCPTHDSDPPSINVVV